MDFVYCESYDEVSRKAADIIEGIVRQKPEAILGLATGSSPIGLYQEMIRRNREVGLDFSRVTTYNLDEYYPISANNSQSYRYFMNKQLFDHVKFKETHVPSGESDKPEEECARYDAMIGQAGGIDVQVLGIGSNGHIGFNEPDDKLVAGTHVTSLTKETIIDNSRFFDSIDDVPQHAITMGMGAIMEANRIILIVSGNSKKQVLEEIKTGIITTRIPASMLNMRSGVTVLVDKSCL